MAVPIFRYPLDPTGVNPDNLVVREKHSLIPKARPTDVRVACPKYGPFYGHSNLTILDAANGRALDRDIDYKVTDLLQDPTLSFGQNISQFIVITNGAVSNELEISYQVLGGNYQNDTTAVKHAFETFLNDTRPVDWSNITGRPATFPPSLHLHLLSDIINFGPLVVAIDALKDAKLLNNTPMFEALIDWINSKKTSWNDITDRPTTASDMGLTDVVFNIGDQVITGRKTFVTAVLQRTSFVQSSLDASIDAPVNLSDLNNVANNRVPKTTKVVAGRGMTGGGALDGDVTLDMNTPGTLTRSSDNVADALGHTHKVNVASLSGETSDLFANGADPRIVNAVPNTRRIVAGKGLITGGALTGDVTLDMGPPLTITKTSQNAVTEDGHTHELDVAAIASGIFPLYWRNKAPLRAYGAWYTNNTDTYRTVSMACTANRSGNSTLWAYVSGPEGDVMVAYQQTSWDHAASNWISFQVPPHQRYKIDIGNSGSGIIFWSELSTVDALD